MSLKQNIDKAKDKIEPAVFDEALARTAPALDQLRAQYADGSLPLLRLPEKSDDIAPILSYAEILRNGSTDIVFLGTGGSSLGGQTLAQLAGYRVPVLGEFLTPRLHFLDNLDPDSFNAALARLPLQTTRFVTISKSGGTGETLMQTASANTAILSTSSNPHERFFGITEPIVAGRTNKLRDFLKNYDAPTLDHDPGVGGRFSVLTNVGILPAAISRLDVPAIRSGAANALAPILASKSPAEIPAAVGAALAVAANKPINVMMAYADKLERFTHWYVQLWAESLGKEGKGLTPVAALGPVDQHSQLQLFNAGPRDKLFTIVTVETAGLGPKVDNDMSQLIGEPDFGGKTIGDLVAAQGRATAETLAKNGCPVRTIHLDKADERHVGELLMHFMLETIIAAHLLGVDPFDQPAVEEGKVLAKKYLAGG